LDKRKLIVFPGYGAWFDNLLTLRLKRRELPALARLLEHCWLSAMALQSQKIRQAQRTKPRYSLNYNASQPFTKRPKCYEKSSRALGSTPENELCFERRNVRVDPLQWQQAPSSGWNVLCKNL
jgi:hypothetical protein